MARKILAGLGVLLLVAMAGSFMLIKTKGDALLQKFSAFVEETTGAPLVMDALPALTFSPQPGLDLGRASWGREDGDLFVRFERASVRVSAKSLLMGRLDITRMEIDGLDLTARSGTDTPQPDARTAARASGPAEKTEEDPWDSARLEERLTRILTTVPDALAIRDGHIRLLRADGSLAEFSHVNLSLENARPGADTRLALQAAVNGSQPDFSGALELNAEATLSGSSLDLTLSKAVFTPATGPPLPLSIRGKFGYRPHDNLLNVDSVASAGPDAELAVSGSLARLPALIRDPAHSAGPVSLDFGIKGSPRALLAALNQPPPLSDSAVPGSAALSGHLDFASGTLKLSALDGMLDDTSLGGELEARLEPPALSGDLRLGDVRLTPYLRPSGSQAKTGPKKGTAAPAADPAAKNGASPGVDWENAPELGLDLRVQSLEFAGIRVEELQTRLEGKNGVYTLNPLSCHAFGSPVTAALEAGFRRDSPDMAADVTLDVSAPQVDLRRLSAVLPPRIRLEGMGNINATLTCLTSNPVPTLGGKGGLSASPLSVKTDILPPDMPGAAEVDRNTRFDKAMLTFQASKGVVTITDCTLSAPKIQAKVRGDINLPGGTLDLAGTMEAPGLAALPVRLTGPLSSPAYHLDTRATIKAVDRALKKKGARMEKEFQKGLGRLLKKK